MSIKDWIKGRAEKAEAKAEAKETAKTDEKGDMKENVMPGLQPPQAEPEQPPVLDGNDYRKLANSKYEQVKDKFKTVFVIQHVKTKKVAELKAASPMHAANMIGWRPRHTKLISSHEEK